MFQRHCNLPHLFHLCFGFCLVEVLWFFPRHSQKNHKMKRSREEEGRKPDSDEKGEAYFLEPAPKILRILSPALAWFSVANELLSLVRSLPEDSPLLGSLLDSCVRMPRHADKGTVLTWEKFVKTCAGKVVNAPTSIHDCWFVQANFESGKKGTGKRVHQVKLSRDGSKNKWMTTRVLYVLLHPETYLQVGSRSSNKDKDFCLHRCGHGRALVDGGPVCINPYHLKLGTIQSNRHDERCGHGCQLCPHPVKCIFNWSDTGLGKWCFNQPRLPLECGCARACSHSDSMPADAGGSGLARAEEKDGESKDTNRR